MIGLVIRILVLCSVVFAVVYAITRALRSGANSKQAEQIIAEVKKLRLAVEQGDIDAEEYAVVADRIRRDCARLGIEAPDFPERLPKARRDV
jgi:uncharacterized membrane protein